MRNVNVVEGDITWSVKCDAIITAINPFGDWFGGVDFAIRRSAGTGFHSQARELLSTKGLNDGQVFIAKGDDTDRNFKDVIFVVDDVVQPLSKITLAALEKANEAGYTSVAMPLMRTGVARGIMEETLSEVILQIYKGITQFQEEYGSDMQISIVVYNNRNATKELWEIIEK